MEVPVGKDMPKHMLVCRVLCGQIRQMGQQIKRNMTRLDLPSEDYDSVEGGPHRPTQAGAGTEDSLMYVVYQSVQVYPEFVVTYRLRDHLEQAAAIPTEAP